MLIRMWVWLVRKYLVVSVIYVCGVKLLVLCMICRLGWVLSGLVVMSVLCLV